METFRDLLASLDRKELEKFALQMHDIMMDIDEISSKAVLRWNENLTDKDLLKMVANLSKKYVKNTYRKYKVL